MKNNQIKKFIASGNMRTENATLALIYFKCKKMKEVFSDE